MEKVHKPLNPAGNKRQRKTSSSTAAVDTKKMKKNKSMPVMKPQVTDAKLKPEVEKLQNDIKPITMENNKTASVNNAQTGKKKKGKKPQEAAKIETSMYSPSKVKKAEKQPSDVETVNITSPLKKKKKHTNSLTESSTAESKISKKTEIPAESNNVTSPIKKKKKYKQLMSEFNSLKEQVIGQTVSAKTEENSTKDSHKVPKMSADEKESIEEKYPVLKDKDLVTKFMNVPLSNNQKGRIRQAIKLQLQGSDQTMFPDIINGKIQAILNTSSDLIESELRRVRILYNLLKAALYKPEVIEKVKPKKKKDKKRKEKKEKGLEGEEKKEGDKKKGPKRYVVFVGNLPLDVTKEMIMEHFRELNEHIVDVRIPKQREGAKSAIAYIELSNEPSYELALSKHHSMLGNQRIRVLYSTQKNSKISKGEAKSKSAKLVALRKAGKLVGSVPATKKRSHRRAIMKQAKKMEAASAEVAQ